jgi:hypothetical protein
VGNGEPDDRSLATFLVERYWPGVTEEAVRRAGERLREAAAELRREGVPLRYLRSTLVPEEETVFSVFGARSVGDVAEANRRGGVPFDRIVRATDIGAPEEGRTS